MAKQRRDRERARNASTGSATGTGTGVGQGTGASAKTTRHPSGQRASAEELAPRSERRVEALKQRREQRLQTRERQRRQQLVKRASLGLAGLLVLASLAWIGNTAYREWQDNRALAAVKSYQPEAGHVQEKVDYNPEPPVGGKHHPTWQNCGFYAAPIANENGVHSLEHGAVWITYRPDLPAGQIDQLRALAESQTYILVSPYADAPSPVVASAWGKQIQLDSVDDERLDAFIREYRQGPQTPEPGASCTGGTSATE